MWQSEKKICGRKSAANYNRNLIKSKKIDCKIKSGFSTANNILLYIYIKSRELLVVKFLQLIVMDIKKKEIHFIISSGFSITNQILITKKRRKKPLRDISSGIFAANCNRFFF